MRVLVSSINIFILFSIFPTIALSDVIVHDMVVPTNKKVLLKAEVKGKLFSKGGEVVEFFVNEKSIGKSLSGGDGFAFKQFTPLKTGMYSIKARAGKEEGKGLLSSLKKGAKIVFIDVEGSLLERFSQEPKKGSQEVIKGINKKYPVVFLQTGALSSKAIKKLLKRNKFVISPVIFWDQGVVFNEIIEQGFKIKAVIGGPYVIESAKDFKPLAFSFVDVEGSVEVKDWKEIGKKLR
ncbi:MAG TPA: hypothetical protein VEF37_03495 [Thermodesulfovibrionales bacterium]|nr:hypothetical protein [Thermodesulfovibrionales bacterium]